MNLSTNIDTNRDKVSKLKNGEWRYSDSKRAQFAETIRQDGFCILRNHFPIKKLQIWKSEFDPILKGRIADGTASERGLNRYYISLPFKMPFADSSIYADPDILDIVERAAEGEIVMPELATDTPLSG